MHLDKIDRAILRALQDDARLANVDLAGKVGLSPSACSRRVHALEREGVIRGYHAALDEARLGGAVQVIVMITLSGQSAEKIAEFEAAVARVPEVLVCYLMTGVHDYLLRVAARDLADFERIHKERLSPLPHVVKMESSFTLRAVVNQPLSVPA
ncbi:Lrp/AsnC family transcriptional regulator [Futiania mangrovi]|uniref:Lrp/AsnC family transcriptional regulator n=1 Tax=Futiania mangrovi TaxID=2959716 RepID=A0A9J6PFT0_9PROT|nr:Lrp/AsnC family transcriptional regulator [Futiania mangrovii]MCP1337326.1 Lrp/AsnC family transcriptional regulator [Futiania mangrovii]